jgi:hypothetical protein
VAREPVESRACAESTARTHTSFRLLTNNTVRPLIIPRNRKIRVPQIEQSFDLLYIFFR